MKRKLLLVLTWLVILGACQEKSFDPENPQSSFALAKEPYDDGNYEIALSKLGEFKTRFPYSNYAAEAEILIANSHFELGQYPEANAAYSHFIKLHPNHPKVPFAQFRIGETYWADAPEAINREQDLTAKAIKEWDTLLAQHPQSEYAAKAKELIKKGRRRIAESEEFIASFYCKQEIWHACAYRYIGLADNAPSEFGDIIKRSLNQAAYALEKLASSHANEANSDKNLFFRKFTPEQLQRKAKEMRDKGAGLP